MIYAVLIFIPTAVLIGIMLLLARAKSKFPLLSDEAMEMLRMREVDHE